jgi:arylsulfatase A-like enzyme
LKDKGISDNTLIIFSSDNGGPKPKEVTDNGHLRGAKGGVWEGGVRVPAFAVWNGKIKPNTVSQQLIHITDLYPTLINIAGAKLEQEKPLDGFDLTDVLLNDKPHQRTEILLNADERDGAVRSGDWKLIAVHRRKENPPFFKNILYNLKDDPGETTDLAKEHPEKVQELLEKYEKYAGEAAPALLNPRPENFQRPYDVWGND